MKGCAANTCGENVLDRNLWFGLLQPQAGHEGDLLQMLIDPRNCAGACRFVMYTCRFFTHPFQICVGYSAHSKPTHEHSMTRFARGVLIGRSSRRPWGVYGRRLGRISTELSAL